MFVFELRKMRSRERERHISEAKESTALGNESSCY